ncbi:MAG: hypothetical protein K6G40_06660 [Eubacterium sp.]|nr:hypothetical protein [Eubacterium sp.]
MKYIFLTVDGVLNTIEQIQTRKFTIDPEKLRYFSILCKVYGGSVVVTSSWSRAYNATDPKKSTAEFKELLRYFKKYNITFAGITPVLNGRKKGEEIKRFLENHSCEDYIILDNTSAGYYKESNLIVINPKKGLNPEVLRNLAARIERK